MAARPAPCSGVSPRAASAVSYSCCALDRAWKSAISTRLQTLTAASPVVSTARKLASGNLSAQYSWTGVIYERLGIKVRYLLEFLFALTLCSVFRISRANLSLKPARNAKAT